MRNRSLLLLAAVTVFAGAFAEIGCSSDSSAPANPATSGAGAGPGSTGAMTTSTGAGMGGGTTGSSAGGGTTGTGTTGTGGGSSALDCAAYADKYCTEFKSCKPAEFTLLFENDTICKALTTKSCMDHNMLDGATGLTDPAGCVTAQTATCEGLFGRVPPAACKAKPGTKKDMEACEASSQCIANEYCYANVIMPGCPGYCTMSNGVGMDCQDNNALCNPVNGEACVLKFDAMKGATGDPSTCEIVAYGKAGDDCFTNTEKACDYGFTCSVATKKCVAALEVNSPCDPVASLCDIDQGLSCQKNAQNANVCTAPAVVNIGAQCGLVNGVFQICSQYAICTASKCEARVESGQPCTAAPDNCVPGLACSKAATCQPPAPPNCN